MNALQFLLFGLAMFYLCSIGSSSSVVGTCPCLYQSDCDIILSADAVIIGKVIFRTRNTLTIVVISSFSGKLRVGQTLVLSFNPNCFAVKLNGFYLLSLFLNNGAYSVDGCGFHLLTTQISSGLFQILRDIDRSCPRNCIDDFGIVHADGETWNPRPCQHCSCDNGQLSCIMISCPRPDCDNPIFVEGECCPVCQQDCSLVRCAEPTCPVPLVQEGECCGTCSEDCRLVLCPALDCPNYRYEPGKCCPTCFDCSQIMCTMQYCPGQYRSPASCCPVCPDCSAVLCLALENCENPYVPEGQCCPVCLDK